MRCIELLGVKLQFSGCGTPLRFSLRKVLLRLRAIRWTQAPTPTRAALIRSLVAPCYSWAAGIAVPDDQEISLVPNEVIYAFHDKLGGEPPKLLIYELLGWFLEPNYQIDIVSLQRFWRWRPIFQCGPRTFLSSILLHNGMSTCLESLPRFRS